MKNLNELNAYRDRSPAVIKFYGSAGDHETGVFRLPYPRTGVTLAVICTANGDGWDHVSVSLPNRCPNWPEMEFIKRTFFKDDEVAMQLHVTPKEHISVHPYCLHIWRPVNAEIPLPPSGMVG